MEVKNNKQLERIFVINETIVALKEELDRCKQDLLSDMEKDMVDEVVCEYGKAKITSFDRGTLNQEKVLNELDAVKHGADIDIDKCKKYCSIYFLMCRAYEDAVIPLLGDEKHE